jgi:hypothetical protein
MKAYRDTVIAVLGLVLAVLAMSGTLATGAYSAAARAEARGNDALIRIFARGHRTAAPVSAWMAANEVNQ